MSSTSLSPLHPIPVYRNPRNPLWRLCASALTALSLCFAPAVLAQDEDEAPPARIARLSVADGTVSFAPAGSDDWVEANPSRPLTQGDKVWVEKGGRAEMRVGSTAARMGGATQLDISDLNDRDLLLTLSQGSLSLRVRQLDRDDSIEIDTPNLALSIREPGEYRLDVDPDRDTTTVTVRNGDARVFGNADKLPPQSLRRNQRVTFSGDDLFRVDVSALTPRDDFDRWVASRDERDDRSQSARYVSREMTGYEDLDEYGEWEENREYGAVWYPRVTVVDWAPYHHGHWAWIAPWGWTWVDAHRWGFAPFHYGRWARVGPRWGWVPGPVVHRPVYAPALVGFVGGNGGGGGVSWSISLSVGNPGVAWFALAPGEIYRPAYTRNSVYITRVNNHRHDNRPHKQPDPIARDFYRNQRERGAIMAMPAQDFVKGRHAQDRGRNLRDDNQREWSRMPVSTGMPIAPVRESRNGGQRPVAERPPQKELPRRIVGTRTAPDAPAMNDRLARRFAEQNGTAPGAGPAVVGRNPREDRRPDARPDNGNERRRDEQRDGPRNDQRNATPNTPDRQPEAPRMRSITREIGEPINRTDARPENPRRIEQDERPAGQEPRRERPREMRDNRPEREEAPRIEQRIEQRSDQRVEPRTEQERAQQERRRERFNEFRREPRPEMRTEQRNEPRAELPQEIRRDMQRQQPVAPAELPRAPEPMRVERPAREMQRMPAPDMRPQRQAPQEVQRPEPPREMRMQRQEKPQQDGGGRWKRAE